MLTSHLSFLVASLSAVKPPFPWPTSSRSIQYITDGLPISLTSLMSAKIDPDNSAAQQPSPSPLKLESLLRGAAAPAVWSIHPSVSRQKRNWITIHLLFISPFSFRLDIYCRECFKLNDGTPTFYSDDDDDIIIWAHTHTSDSIVRHFFICLSIGKSCTIYRRYCHCCVQSIWHARAGLLYITQYMWVLYITQCRCVLYITQCRCVLFITQNKW